MENIRTVKHKYHSLGFDVSVSKNLDRIKGFRNKLDIIFDNLSTCVTETIGSKTDLQKQINEIMQDEIKRATKTQIVDIPVVWLKEDDLIFDYGRKTIERVKYTRLYNSKTHDEDDKPNTVLVAYIDDGDCDNFDIKAKVSIVVNPTATQLINFNYM